MSRLSTGLYFDSVEAANALDSNTIKDWASPTGDLTIPMTKAERIALVKVLVEDIKNTTGCLALNSIDRTAFQNRWGTNADFFPEYVFEVVAWRILVCFLNHIYDLSLTIRSI